MPVMAVAITKQRPYRGGVQRFSNVYHFLHDGVQQFFAEDTINALVDIELPLTSEFHLFVEGRAWGPTEQGKAASKTLAIIDYNRSGAKPHDPSLYSETAHLFQFECERRNVLGRKKYLRKWMHFGNPHGFPPDGSAPAPQGARDELNRSFGDRIVNLVTAAGRPGIQLCTPMGERIRSDGANVMAYYGGVYPWLEHRQFGDQWR